MLTLKEKRRVAKIERLIFKFLQKRARYPVSLLEHLDSKGIHEYEAKPVFLGLLNLGRLELTKAFCLRICKG